jgi:hypothetical protein
VTGRAPASTPDAAEAPDDEVPWSPDPQAESRNAERRAMKMRRIVRAP